jgi:prepilin-type processing-associated H-X9-DG protein
MTIYRLREGIERFFITDINNPAGSAVAQSAIPIMWDNWMDSEDTEQQLFWMASEFNHIPGGCNVLYLDGHVRFMRYGGNQFGVGAENYPVTDELNMGILMGHCVHNKAMWEAY